MSSQQTKAAARAASKREGDYIAGMVLKLVRQVVEDSMKQPVDDGLEHFFRPEPPEARLGYMPKEAA